MPPIHSNDKSTDYLEVVAVRLYNFADQDKVLRAYQQISTQSHALKCTLYENKNYQGTWSIHLYWTGPSQPPTQSPEATCLAALLKEIGLVHHMVLAPVAKSSP